jgi:hypothetical protein
LIEPGAYSNGGQRGSTESKESKSKVEHHKGLKSEAYGPAELKMKAFSAACLAAEAALGCGFAALCPEMNS